MERVLKIFTPLVTFIIAIVIKICFIDDFHGQPNEFIFDTYIKHLWLEVFLIALGFSFLEKKEKEKEQAKVTKSLTPYFVLIGIACAILVFALPKFNVESIFLSTWVPAGLCFILFVAVSAKLSK